MREPECGEESFGGLATFDVRTSRGVGHLYKAVTVRITTCWSYAVSGMARTPSTTIRDATRGDLAAMRRIMDVQIGHGQLEVTLDALSEDGPGFALVAVVDRTVAGLCLCSVMKPGSIARALRSGLPDVLRARRIGLLDTVAVAPGMTGRGLGSALVDEARARFRARKVRVWATAAWKSPEGVTVSTILARAGMQPFTEVPDFWREASLSQGFRCPACGTPPCTCSAVMYAGQV